VKDLNGIVVVNSGEWRDNGFQFRCVTLQDFEFLTSVFEHACRDIRKHAFGEIHHVVERCICHFRLDHPELSQVPAGLRLLCPESWTKTISFSERRGRRFVVKLA
jgi:hypothetical protein